MVKSAHALREQDSHFQTCSRICGNKISMLKKALHIWVKRFFQYLFTFFEGINIYYSDYIIIASQLLKHFHQTNLKRFHLCIV